MTLATVANLYQQANHQSCYHHEDEAKEEPYIKSLPTDEVVHGKPLTGMVVEICTVVVRHDIPRNGGGNDDEQNDGKCRQFITRES